MIPKRPIDLRRLRSLPPPSGFGWIDHRLLREGYFQRCSPAALALYSLLICAGDSQGLSFYSQARLAEILGLEQGALRQARDELIDAQLIAFQKPIFQVLALVAAPTRPSGAVSPRRPAGESVSAQPAQLASPPPPVRAAQAEPAAPAPAGMNLSAMVLASLRKGGAQ